MALYRDLQYQVLTLGRHIIEMYADQSPAQNQPPSTKDRGYICPCGKSYLSYPALFTHIKQKHGGKAPGQVIRPKSLNKRGRPKKDFNRAEKEQASEQASPQSDQSQWDNTYKDRLKSKNNDKQRKSNGQFIKSRSVREKLQSQSYTPQEEQQELSSYDRLLILKEKFNNLFKSMTDSNAEKIAQIVGKCETYQQLINMKSKKSAPKPSSKHKPVNKQPHSQFNEFGLDLELGSDRNEEQADDKEQRHEQGEQQEQQRQHLKYNAEHDCYEVQMGRALVQFMNWIEEILPQTSQICFFIAFLCEFFSDEIDAGCLHNLKFSQLISNFNNFIYYFLIPLRRNDKFSDIFILMGDRPLHTIILLNEWMQIHKYTYHRIRVNPHWKGDRKDLK